MTTITAKVIQHSITPEGIVGITWQTRYPRPIHSELLTHRAFSKFSRNARSSRAVPVAKIIEEVMIDPYIPIHWGKNQKGMQAYEECTNPIFVPSKSPSVHSHDMLNNERAWLLARDEAVTWAQRFVEAGYHKQIVNRLLEPWAHIDTLITTTQTSNFFALRDHPAAAPEMQRLALEMKTSMQNSEPKRLGYHDWHAPYTDDCEHLPFWDRLKVSVARCARLSYKPFDSDKPSTFEEDCRLHDELVANQPVHASPAEHQFKPDRLLATKRRDYGEPEFQEEWECQHLHGNLRGVIQYRKTLPGECQ